MKSFHFYNIHLLRAFAALSVVIYHVVEILPWTDFPSSPEPLLWVRVGWMGVDLFFVISGFVISLSAIRLLREMESPFVRTYLRHRAARIIPLYYLTGIVFVLFITPTLLTVPGRDYHLLTHIFFVHNLFTDTHGSINGANWSIGTEVQFYLLILLACPWLSRANPWWILGGSLLVAWGWRAGVYLVLSLQGGGVMPTFIYTSQLPGMLDEFGFGVFLARFVLDGFPPLPACLNGLSGRFEAVARRGVLWLVAAVVTFLVSWEIYWSYPAYWDSWLMVTFWRSSIALAFFFVVGAAVFVRFPGWVERFLLPPFHYLGEISFGIYLWHLPVILALKESGITDPFEFSALTLLFVISFAAFSWHFVERPLIRKYR